METTSKLLGSPLASPLGQAILAGGLAAAVLDGADAIVAYRAVLGIGPVTVYQFVASGMLGPDAFTGGVPTALVGVGVHFLVAFSAAAAFALASTKLTVLRRHWAAAGALFGVAVWAVMNLIVIPLSKIPPAPFSLPLFLNGILGHAVFVGLPIAWASRRLLGDAESAGGAPATAH